MTLFGKWQEAVYSDKKNSECSEQESNLRHFDALQPMLFYAYWKQLLYKRIQLRVSKFSYNTEVSPKEDASKRENF